MDFVPLQRAVVRIHTAELNILTQVVLAHPAQEALLAWNPRFHGHTIARLQICDAFAALDNHTRCLMAQDAVCLKNERANAAGFPEMDVRAADSRRLNVDQAFVWARGVDGCFDRLEFVVRRDLEGRVRVWCLEDVTLMLLRM